MRHLKKETSDFKMERKENPITCLTMFQMRKEEQYGTSLNYKHFWNLKLAEVDDIHLT